MHTLKSARTYSGMGVREAARKLGVCETTLRNWETGKTNPKLSDLKVMSDIYGVPINEFFLSNEQHNVVLADCSR